MGFQLLSTPTYPRYPNALELFELALAVHHVYEDVDTRFAGFADVMGAQNAFIWRTPHELLPNVGFFAFEEGIVLACAGTTNAEQWLSQILYSRLEEAPEFRGWTSSFWRWAYNEMAFNVPANFQWAGAGRKIVITGHSFGAVMALLAACDLAQRHDPDQLYLVTYGTPKPGYWEDIPYTGHHWNCMNALDPVPYLPPTWSRFLEVDGGVLAAVGGYRNFHHYGRRMVPARSRPFDDNRPAALLIENDNTDIWGKWNHETLAELYLYYGANTLFAQLNGFALRRLEQITEPTQWFEHPMRRYLHYIGDACEARPGIRADAHYQRMRQYFRGGVWIPDRPPPTPPRDDGGKERDFLIVGPPPPEDAPQVDAAAWQGLFDEDPADLVGAEVFSLFATVSTTLEGYDMANLFRGRDRQRLVTAVQVLENILSRDTLARDTTVRTQALSTREEMIPVADEALFLAANNLVNHLRTKLEAQAE